MSPGPKGPETPGARDRGLEDLGYVAGGIAHDFNGLLTGILGYASFLKLLLREGSKEFSAADAIERSARRASDLTRRMIECSSGEIREPRPVPIDRIVRKAVDMLSSSATENVEILADLHAPPGHVPGDPDTLLRALLHLGENAIEAMPAGGRLTFSTRPFASDGSVSFDDVPVPEGDYVSIVVSDTGRGIPESLRRQVFDIFFTTKPGGNGIGLPIVSRVVRKHDGYLRMESGEGAGATFEILLPIPPSSA